MLSQFESINGIAKNGKFDKIILITKLSNSFHLFHKELLQFIIIR